MPVFAYICRYSFDSSTKANRARSVGVQPGEITELHVGFKGMMNALYLKDLADKTRRGLRGRVEAGKSGGGRCFGYRNVRNARAETTGEHEVEPGRPKSSVSSSANLPRERLPKPSRRN
jgi:hypothetical protein